MRHLSPKKAASFNLGTVKKGQDDKMYKVVKQWAPVAKGARMVRRHMTVTAEDVRAYFARKIAKVTREGRPLSNEQFQAIVDRSPPHIASHCDFAEISLELWLDILVDAEMSLALDLS